MKKILFLGIFIAVLLVGCTDNLVHLGYGDFKVAYPEGSYVLYNEYPELEYYSMKKSHNNGCDQSVVKDLDFNKELKETESWFNPEIVNPISKKIGVGEAIYLYDYDGKKYLLKIINCDGDGYSVKVSCPYDLGNKEWKVIEKIIKSSECQ